MEFGRERRSSSRGKTKRPPADNRGAFREGLAAIHLQNSGLRLLYQASGGAKHHLHALNYRLYIDEVGNADLKASADPRHQYLSLTGVIMDYAYVATHLAGHLHGLKWKHFGSHPDGPPLILHRKEMMNKVGPFSILADGARCAAFDADVFALLDQTAFITITTVIDKASSSREVRIVE